jgi:conjugal transfer/entry exclusion protein
MKRILLAGICLLAFAPRAHALFGAGDVVFDPTMHAEQLLNDARQAGDALKQLQQLQQQYQMLHSQYEAIAHLPQTIMSMGRSLITTPTLQNPFPQSYQLQGILSGNSLGPVDGVASGFRQLNTYYEPKGDDPAAVELRRRADSTSGIQALATNAMHSLEQRAAALKDFIGGISASPDLQETVAIGDRLQLENNYASGQQAQAANLKVLADAQVQVNQQRDAEAARQDAADWRQAADQAAHW